MHLNINSHYIETVVSALSGKTGVTAVPGESWAYNLKSKKLHYRKKDLLYQPTWFIRALVIHEMGHVMYTEPFKPSQIALDNPQMREVYNVFEDMRIERLLKNKYGDFFRGPIEAFNNSIFMRFRNGGFSQGTPLLFRFMVSFLSSKTGVQITHPSRYSADEERRFKQAWTDLTDFFNRNNDISFEDSFEQLANNCDKYLYPILSPLFDDKDSESKGKGGNDGNEGASKRESTNANSQSDAQTGDVEPTAMVEQIGTGQSFDSGPAVQTIPSYEEVKALTDIDSVVLSQRIRDVLAEKKAVRYTGRTRTGRLLSRNIAKIVTDETRLFSRRVTPDTPDYKVYIIIDRSGSMQGENAVSAYTAGVMLYNTCLKSRLDVEVWSFNEEVHRIADSNHMSSSFKNFQVNGGTNDNLMFEELAASVTKDNKETIAFVIGDGEGITLDRKNLDTVEKSGFLMGIGIGRGCGDVITQYPNGVVVEKPDEVPMIVLSKMRELIKR